MIDLIRILKEFIEDEYDCFLYDCSMYEEDPADYPTSDDWLINAIKVLWKNKVMDCHGFSLLNFEEMMEKYGNIIVFQYVEFLHNAKPINRLIKLRTLLTYNLRY